MLVAVASTALAQDGGAHATQVVKSTSSLVIVPTLVRAQSGELIRDLDAEHFRVADNGLEQNVHLQQVENEPLAVVVLIQTGGAASTELGNYGKLDSIVRSILGTSPSKLALISFDSRVRQIWAFPPRVDGVEYALTHQAVGDSGAAVRDAVRCGMNILQNQPARFRRIILLLSQEKDSGSKSSLQTLCAMWQEAEPQFTASPSPVMAREERATRPNRSAAVLATCHRPLMLRNLLRSPVESVYGLVAKMI